MPHNASTPSVPVDAARWMDALRAVLALTVAFAHAWVMIVADYQPGDGWAGRPFYLLAGYAHPAVILFFVLSGFWIAKSVAALDRRGWSWRTYLIDRLSRLGIVIVPALAIGGALDMTGLYALRTATHLDLTGVWFFTHHLSDALSLPVLLGNLAFLQQIIVPPFGTNGPLWSVAFEFWYYVWFAALWVTIRQRRPQWFLLTLALGWFSTDLIAGFFAWLCGAAAYHATGRIAAGRALWPLLGLLAAVLIWARLGDWRGEDILVAAAAALALIAMVARNPGMPRLLTPLAWLGARSSFSLYATHFPLVALLAGVIVGPRRLAPGPGGIAIVMAVTSVAVVAAIGFSRLTEAKTGALRRWMKRRAPAVA